VSNRYRDWLRQAEADLRHAQNAADDGDFEWACFAAQQAAEKGIKAVFLNLGADAWGHTLTVLLGNLAARDASATRLVDAAKRLDKHYIPTRYPNGFDEGAPTDFYTFDEAERAITDARTILEYCRDALD
jgi:HEPN domain-containing protein